MLIHIHDLEGHKLETLERENPESLSNAPTSVHCDDCYIAHFRDFLVKCFALFSFTPSPLNTTPFYRTGKLSSSVDSGIDMW